MRFLPLALISSSFVSGYLRSAEESADPESALIILKNGTLELGILPKVGGSAVIFREVGGENVIYAPSENWLSWQPHLPDPLDLSQWTDFFGHIIWLSPQTDFWNQQDLIPSQHNQLWPPDPYWTYGDFKVVEQTDSSVVLEGPVSPYTGVKMIKCYSLDENGANLSVTAVNGSNHTVKWGLWSNTRVYGDTDVYVPVPETNGFRIEAPDPEVIPVLQDDGYFHFALGTTVEGEALHAKAYLYPNARWMAGFRNGQVFVKIMEPVDRSEVHPNQGVFEVYRLQPNPSAGSPGLTEMEAHAPYLELEPGACMSLSERWLLKPQKLDGNAVSPLEWLNANRSGLDGIEITSQAN